MSGAVPAKRRRTLTANELVERVKQGEKVKDVLEEHGENYQIVERWRRRNSWFAENYALAMRDGHPTRMNQAQFDVLYPGWKNSFVAALCEMDKPSIAAAVDRLNKLGTPLTVNRVYAAKTPGSKWFDDEFAIQVETGGDARKVDRIKGLLEEKLEEKLEDGKELNTALNYLKTHRLSPLRDRSDVTVSTKHEDIQTKRLEVRATIADESQNLAQRVKGALNAYDRDPGADNGNTSTEHRADAQGEAGGGAEEEVIEGEIVQEDLEAVAS